MGCLKFWQSVSCLFKSFRWNRSRWGWGGGGGRSGDPSVPLCPLFPEVAHEIILQSCLLQPHPSSADLALECWASLTPTLGASLEGRPSQGCLIHPVVLLLIFLPLADKLELPFCLVLKLKIKLTVAKLCIGLVVLSGQASLALTLHPSPTYTQKTPSSLAYHCSNPVPWKSGAGPFYLSVL